MHGRPSGAGLRRIQVTEMTNERWARSLECSGTGESAELDAPAFLSPAGKPWLVRYDLDPAKGQAWRESLLLRPWTLWRYRELLPVRDFEGRIDLGEGGTPLIRLQRLGPEGVEVLVKEEGGNPSGSFKARGLSLAVNRARELGAPGVQLPSAGNAALALATYAAAGGLPCRVAMPEDTPPFLFERCRQLGAEIHSVAGTLVEAGARLAEIDDGFWMLSTLKEPYRVEGKKTMGLELAEQFDWRLPDWILYPTGGGTGIIGMHKAFDELEALGLIGSERPRFAVVQMAGCAPIVRAFEEGQTSAQPWENPSTRVWGLRVPQAVGDFLILDALRESDGQAVAVEEDRIAEMMGRASRLEGLDVGPEGAACLLALEDLRAADHIVPGQRVVVFQTGHPANYRES